MRVVRASSKQIREGLEHQHVDLGLDPVSSGKRFQGEVLRKKKLCSEGSQWVGRENGEEDGAGREARVCSKALGFGVRRARLVALEREMGVGTHD